LTVFAANSDRAMNARSVSFFMVIVSLACVAIIILVIDYTCRNGYQVFLSKIF